MAFLQSATLFTELDLDPERQDPQDTVWLPRPMLAATDVSFRLPAAVLSRCRVPYCRPLQCHFVPSSSWP